MTGLKQAHVEIKTDTLDGLQAIKKVADGFMRTVAESWIFAGAGRVLLLLPLDAVPDVRGCRHRFPDPHPAQRVRQDPYVRAHSPFTSRAHTLPARSDLAPR